MELHKKKGIPNAKSTNRLGEKIRSLRVSQNISLKDLAKKSDLTSSTISQVERGLSNPSIPALRRIAETLGVPVFYFFSDEEVDESIIIVRKNALKTYSPKISALIFSIKESQKIPLKLI